MSINQWGKQEKNQLALVIGFTTILTLSVILVTYYVNTKPPKPITKPIIGSEEWCFDRRYKMNPKPEPVPGMTDIAAIFPVDRVTALKKNGEFINWYYHKPCEKLGKYTPKFKQGELLAISQGGYHSISLMADAKVWAWAWGGGGRDFGQLGHVIYIDRKSNKDEGIVWPLKDIIKIAAGERHNLALRSDGRVWAWGGNSCGEVGIMPESSSSLSAFPNIISQLKDVTGIGAGASLSVALKKDGTVWQWGNNDWYLENTMWSNRHCFLKESSKRYPPLPEQEEPVAQPMPKQVEGLKDITAISLSYRHTLALRRDGTVWAWGLNDCNQLGVAELPNRAPFASIPIQVPGLSNVIAVSAGRRHSMALKKDGTGWEWGHRTLNSENYGGCIKALEDSKSANQTRATLREVKLPGKATAIAAGIGNSIALLSDGTVWSWGQK
ncbi:MAG: hypothetical protein V4525_02230 [Pseudomonadota bacterium]